MKTAISIVVWCILCGVVTESGQADTFVVFNTNGSGVGSLRQGIIAANNMAGGDTIIFKVSGSIFLLTELPALDDEDGLVIDGATAPDDSIGPDIILDGSKLSGAVSGLSVYSSNNVINGLFIHGFHNGIVVLGSNNTIGGPAPREGNVISANAQTGLSIQAAASRNTIHGNFVGTDVTGTVALGNREGLFIFGDAIENTIGGTLPGARNIISGNQTSGIAVQTSGNAIIGNFIGTDVTGATALPNRFGVMVSYYVGHDNVIGGTQEGARNVISGNDLYGIWINYGATANTIVGNFVGVDNSGTVSLGNGAAGVLISGSNQNTIGGTEKGAGNIISGNMINQGVTMEGVEATGNRVLGNAIGTDKSGMVALGNGHGLTLQDGAHNNTIGGLEPDAGNVIAGSLRAGLRISGAGTDQNRIIGNLIGIGKSGNVPLGNREAGVEISEGASRNIIGGGASGTRNIIAHNGSDGVTVHGGNTTGNAIRGNSISDNANRGINLTNGGNGELAPPVIASLRPVGGTAPPGSLVEIFRDDADEGRDFLDSVRADPESGTFACAIDFFKLQGNVTATATDSSGNTSEFSLPIPITPLPEWLVPVSVHALGNQGGESLTTGSFELAFGGHPRATDGFDVNLDVLMAPPAFDYYAFFSIPELPRYLSGDYRQWMQPYEQDIEWTLQVVNAVGLNSVVLWDPAELPPQGSFRLKSVPHGLDVDMRRQDSVQFAGEASLKIQYRPVECVEFVFPVQGGAWYLISLPVISTDNSLDSLFPGAVAAFGWDFAAQAYEPARQLEPERAYWLLLSEAATVEVCGQPVKSYWHDYAAPGWDLTGAATQTSTLHSDPANSVLAMFGWNPLRQDYVPIDPYQVEPKQGYWILVFGTPSSVTVGGSSATGGTVKQLASIDLTAMHEKFGKLPPPPPIALADNQSPSIPDSYWLSQNYPNPFNPETIIAYQLPKAGQVSLQIFDMLGREVRTLITGEIPAGYHRARWDGNDNAGHKLNSSVYLCRLQAGDFEQTRKLILLK